MPHQLGGFKTEMGTKNTDPAFVSHDDMKN